MIGMAGYTKLFNSILASSVWQESVSTKVLWITFLAMADKDGIAEASVPGLAKIAGLSLADTEAGIKSLSAPDKYSRTRDFDGRRIEACDGGWRILNHAKYRRKMNADDRREYKRQKQQEYRAASKSTKSTGGQSGHNAEAEAEAEAKEQTDAAEPKKTIIEAASRVYREPPMPDPTPVPGWEAKAKAVWSRHLGGENDYIYADLVPVVRKFGEAKAIAAWEAYCEAQAKEQGGKFASARSFAQKPGPWIPKDRPKVEYMTAERLLATQR